MRKLILMFLLIFSFDLFPEEIKEPEEIKLERPSKLFEGVDLDRILREAVEKADKELGIDIYLEEMNKLIEKLKEEKIDPG